jgi:hypothetical protein
VSLIKCTARECRGVRHDRHFSAASKFPDRRITRSADGIERQAGAGLATTAYDLKPAITAVQTLRDGRRRLRRPAKTFHLFGP